MEKTVKGKKSKEIIIENRYNVTKELYRKWAGENKFIKFFKVFGVIFIIFCIGMAILSVIFGEMNDAIRYILLALYTLFVFVIMKKNGIDKRYKMLVKLYKKADWERRIIFYNDYFESIDAGMNQIKIQYNDIVRVEKKDDCLKVKLNAGYIRIYKDSFVKSNFEECEKFLNSKIK